MTPRLALCLLAAVLVCPVRPARAEVLSLKMGLTPSCPYGLAA